MEVDDIIYYTLGWSLGFAIMVSISALIIMTYL
jgi:hypothetical protein